MAKAPTNPTAAITQVPKAKKSQQRATNSFTKQRQQEVGYCSFVGQLNSSDAYEIWFKEDGEWNVAVIVLHRDGSDEIYDSLTEVFSEFNNIYRQGQDALSVAGDRRIRLWVGAIGFLSTLAAVLWMAATKENDLMFAAAIVSVLASGCVAIFGIWMPNPMGRRPTEVPIPK